METVNVETVLYTGINMVLAIIIACAFWQEML